MQPVRPPEPCGEAQDRIYCYPGSNTLINRLNERDNARFEHLERSLSAARIAELVLKPLPGELTPAYLCALHRHIFQDLFSWAGEFRSVDISKGYFFCRPAYIGTQLRRLLGDLAAEDCLRKLPGARLPQRLAYYFGELNAIHPFRDGNGRTQREFFRELLRRRGLEICFANVPPALMLSASIASFKGDLLPLTGLFEACLAPPHPLP